MTRRPTPVRWLKEHPLLADSLLAGLLLLVVILSITGGDTSAHGVNYRDANALATASWVAATFPDRAWIAVELTVRAGDRARLAQLGALSRASGLPHLY